MRIFEWKTDDLIKEFAKRYELPAGHLPSDDYLWIDEFEVAAQQLAWLSLGTRGRTTFTDTVPALVAKGSIRERYIARRGDQARPARVYVPLCYDLAGRAYLVVQNYAGEYQDEEGTWHNAFQDGYTRILKQYLYCFDVINTAIAQLEGRTVKAVPRWQQKTPSTGETLQPSLSRDDDQKDTATRIAISGGKPNSTTHVEVSTVEDTIDGAGASTVTQKVRSNSDLRIAPWTVETILALQSAVLPVPDPATCDPAIWDKEWQRPTELAMVKLSTLSPVLAWERIDLTTRYMIDDSSPSYWRTGRTKQTPTTMRHVANHIVDYYDAYKKSPWHPATTTPYDGPPLTYEAGYTGITQETPEPSIIVEEPEELPRQPWMTKEEATDLCNEIWDACALMPSLTPLDNALTRWYTSVQWGPGKDDWLDFADPDAWRLPSPETVDRVEQALRFAAERNAIPTEVGVIEEQPEPPPLIEETAPNDVPAPDGYVSMEEITADLQRGLRPLSTPLSVEVAPVVEKSPPMPVPQQGKAGMSLWIAEQLLDQIESAGYAAQLRPISDDRATITVEASPGTWIDIDSGVAWAKHVKSVAQSPPGSVASVIAMESGVMQQVAAQS